MTSTIDHRARGASLLGVVVTLAALGVMAVVAVRVLDEGGATDGSDGAGSPVEQASAVSCQSDVATVERAVNAYAAAQGGYPTTVEELVATGWLDQAPATGYRISLEAVGGQPTGRVLVNDRAGAGACLSAVRTTR